MEVPIWKINGYNDIQFILNIFRKHRTLTTKDVLDIFNKSHISDVITIRLIMDKLRDDKFIKPYDDIKYAKLIKKVVEKKDEDDFQFVITFTGILFCESGGYKRRKRIEFFKEAVYYFGIVVSIYYAIQILISIIKIIHLFCK